MAYEVPQSEEEQVPAIVLYGDALEGMDEARRHEIAASLEILLGVRAVARNVSVEYLESPSNNELTHEHSSGGTASSANPQGVLSRSTCVGIEPTEAIPPFTLLIDDNWGREWGKDRYVNAAEARAPGVIEDPVQAKRALTAILAWAYKGCADPELFTSHLGDTDRYGIEPLRGVTFHDPQRIVDDPKFVQESIPRLGPKSTSALAQFVMAFTRA